MKKLLLILGIAGIVAAIIMVKKRSAAAEQMIAGGAEVFDAPEPAAPATPVDA